MTKSDDHDRDHDNNSESNKPEGPIVPAPAKGALTSLAALKTALNSVSTAAILGRSGQPMLQFKARETDGTWMYGQRRTVPEEGSQWAVNPASFQHGYICFNDSNKVLDERLVSVGEPKPSLAELPNLGFKWQEEMAVGMKCLTGADAGIEVIFKTTTVGGLQAVAGLIEAVRDRLNSGQHDGKISPIVLLERDAYSHGQYGRTPTPQMRIVDWMPLSGPAPAPAPAPTPTPSATPEPAPQPRRRRVG
jgi:hypothetical protein